MQKEFTSHNLARLQELFTTLCFKGEKIQGKFGANVLNPYELLNNTSISTLRVLLAQTRKSKNELEYLDDWSMNDIQIEKNDRLEIWAEFINLLIGYRLDQDKKAAIKAEKAKKAAALRARIETEADKGKTLEELRKELADLEA